MTPLLWIAFAIYYILATLGFWSISQNDNSKTNQPLMGLLAWFWPIWLPITGALGLIMLTVTIVRLRRNRKETLQSLFSSNGGGKE